MYGPSIEGLWQGLVSNIGAMQRTCNVCLRSRSSGTRPLPLRATTTRSLELSCSCAVKRVGRSSGAAQRAAVIFSRLLRRRVCPVTVSAAQVSIRVGREPHFPLCEHRSCCAVRCRAARAAAGWDLSFLLVSRTDPWGKIKVLPSCFGDPIRLLGKSLA